MAPLLGVRLGFVTPVSVINVQHGQMVSVGVGEEVLHLVGTLALSSGADEDLGHRQEGCDGEDFIRAVELRRADEHDGKRWVERELGCQAAQ